ncbi:hypothetical protein K493DRAFT_348779 [Basidiobolus meristosporus CBS 931.73]|uniref:Uncharacterized protein n=1 Tax=Basidiobolus meristosporus CBS 931.73 TaxID=1314790 RepID=A0A1Y1YMX1_9FUNG|nr:hypothetical protein K493DRAFT_348779 [Basidiobolus meristosporus CBS 931.73]|eukprot:ORX99096.1 hypothetical protein K493DRAFT_348779 [Basidiobolus meristosporus CBS 931.73]
MKLLNSELMIVALVASLTGTNGQIFRPISKVQGTDGRSNLPANDLARDILPGPIADLVSAPIIGAASVAANVLKTAGCVIGFCALRSGGGAAPKPSNNNNNNNNGNSGNNRPRVVYVNGGGGGWQAFLVMKFFSAGLVATLAISLTGTNGQIFRPITRVQGTDGRSSLPANDLARDILPGPIADLVSAPIIGAASAAANVLKTAGCVIGACALRSGRDNQRARRSNNNNNNRNNGNNRPRVVYVNGGGGGWNGGGWNGGGWNGGNWNGGSWNGGGWNGGGWQGGW